MVLSQNTPKPGQAAAECNRNFLGHDSKGFCFLLWDAHSFPVVNQPKPGISLENRPWGGFPLELEVVGVQHPLGLSKLHQNTSKCGRISDYPPGICWI